MIAAQWCQERVREKKLAPIDIALAQHVYVLSGSQDETIYWLTALLSYQHRAGHVCIDLTRPPMSPFDQSGCPWALPSSQTLRALQLPALGAPESNAPLVLDNDRVYLRRHWLCEQRISDAIRSRCQPLPWSQEVIASVGQNVFSVDADPWQKSAALNCALHRFGVITGGPGTGKTWTVTRMLGLHLLLAQAQHQALPRIAMAAPTGKAAARLSEALQAALPTLDLADTLRAALPEEAVTLHRLLAMGMTGKPGFHAQRKLPYDIVVVDEASMVDLGLMAQLVDALPVDTALYLVGDRDQLASVQAGSVFADVCGNADNVFNAEVATRLQHAGCESVQVDSSVSDVDSVVVRLQTVHRFSGDSAIASLADAVRTNAAQAVTALQQSRQEELQWLSADRDAIVANMFAHYAPLIDAAREGADAAALLNQFGMFRALAATRRGALGVEQLNAALEQQLQRQFGFAQEGWFPGKAVLLKHNDWNLRLFNGDIGVAVYVPVAGKDDGTESRVLRVAFPSADGGLKLIAPARLPACEPAWAMTIHKSQGSEFDRVLLVLPEQESPVLSRELLYTGITRARSGLAVAASGEQLLACMARPAFRASGLRDRLRDTHWQQRSR